LLPDVVLERDTDTIIFDAKYKEHWEELNLERWGNLDEELRERHRADVLQVLAYSTTSAKKRVVSCLVYPCQNSTWESLASRGRLFHKASLASGDHQIDLVLTAVPMHGKIDETAYAVSSIFSK
jgi:5-methylcytosine-specific restriction endonuclease McrBC regulatory subunit McrC